MSPCFSTSSQLPWDWEGCAHCLIASYTNKRVLKELICLIIKVARDHCKKDTGGETTIANKQKNIHRHREKIVKIDFNLCSGIIDVNILVDALWVFSSVYVCVCLRTCVRTGNIRHLLYSLLFLTSPYDFSHPEISLLASNFSWLPTEPPGATHALCRTTPAVPSTQAVTQWAPQNGDLTTTRETYFLGLEPLPWCPLPALASLSRGLPWTSARSFPCAPGCAVQ